MRIKNPCTESWDEMEGEGAVRFCARCQKSVTDIDAIEEAEVAALLRGDTRCVRGRTDQVGRLVRILAVVGATAVAASASTVPPPAVPQVEAAAIPEVPPEAPTDAPVFDERLMGMGYIE